MRFIEIDRPSKRGPLKMLVGGRRGIGIGMTVQKQFYYLRMIIDNGPNQGTEPSALTRKSSFRVGVGVIVKQQFDHVAVVMPNGRCERRFPGVVRRVHLRLVDEKSGCRKVSHFHREME